MNKPKWKVVPCVMGYQVEEYVPKTDVYKPVGIFEDRKEVESYIKRMEEGTFFMN